MIVDDDMSDILAVYSHMYDSAYMMAFVPRGAYRLHHLFVADTDESTAYIGTHALTCHFLDVGYLAAVVSLLRESIAQSGSDRMRREVLYMRSQMKQFVSIELRWMHRLYGKLAVCERAGLVEHHNAELSQRVHIVAALDEYSAARRTTQSAEERERHTDDQCTRTRNDKEDERSMQPYGKRFDEAARREQRRNNGK